MSYCVMVPNKIMATNVDSMNRSAVSEVAVHNGGLVILSGKSATAGEEEVWTAITPTTSDGLTGVWMAYSPEVVVTVSGSSKYKGLDPDPRNFTNEIATIFDVFKPAVGDIITITADGISTSVAKGSNTFVNATDSTGGLKPVWGATQTASVFSMKLLATTFLSIPDGSVGTQRVTAYEFMVVGL